MKTTIEIADDLFERAQGLARKEKTTFRALAEQGLRLVLKEKRQSKAKKLPPLVTLRGKGLTNEFKSASWDRIRDEIYKGRGGKTLSAKGSNAPWPTVMPRQPGNRRCLWHQRLDG